MRLVAWNLNHRTRSKPIVPGVAEALLALEPDWLVLTEYVAHESHETFFDRLATAGIHYVCVSEHSAKNNRVVIASRRPLVPGAIQAPAVDEAMPSNALHVACPADGIEILGVRLPDYSKYPPLRRGWWDWLTMTADSVVDRPFIIAGDFNTDAGYPVARCGDRLQRLVDSGWRHAVPAEGSSYWTLNGLGKRIDHAFVSRHFRVADVRYVTESAGQRLVGKPSVALSDHAALALDLERIA